MIQIRLFAGAAQLAGQTTVELSPTDLPSNPTVGDVANCLTARYPQLQSLAAKSRWAIGSDFVELECPVESARNLAMIPPVSGG